MAEEQNWDWETGERRIPFGEWKDNFRWVEEPYVSPDGEKIAAIVNIDEGEFSVCVNGEAWEAVFDKIWHLRFTSSGRPTAIVNHTLDINGWQVIVIPGLGGGQSAVQAAAGHGDQVPSDLAAAGGLEGDGQT